MNSAKKNLLKREVRNQAIADTIGWIILAAGAFICAKLLLKALQVFFVLTGIH